MGNEGYLTRCHRCGKLANSTRECKVCGGKQHMKPEPPKPRKRIPLAERQAYIETAPWIRRLSKPTKCDGWMSRRGGCKNPAQWSYRWTSSRWDRQTQKRQHFCWSHLLSRGLYGSMQEEARWDRWTEKNPPPWYTPEYVKELNDEIRRLNEESSRDGTIPGSQGVQPDAEGSADDGNH